MLGTDGVIGMYSTYCGGIELGTSYDGMTTKVVDLSKTIVTTDDGTN